LFGTLYAEILLHCDSKPSLDLAFITNSIFPLTAGAGKSLEQSGWYAEAGDINQVDFGIVLLF
jgi:hypothetical protein